ncbi:MAG: hypothetical protein ACRENE_21330 [Polyangiaceae bacterium]
MQDLVDMKGPRFPHAHHLLSSTLCGAMIGAVGCSSTSGSPPSTDPFVGSWECSVSATISYSMPTTNTAMNMSTNTDVITDDGHGHLTIVRTGEGDAGFPACTLHATLSADGKSTNAVTPESCPGAFGLTQTVTSGTATIGSDGTTYTNRVTYTLEGTNAKGAPVVGTGLAMGSCTKM